MRHLLVAPQIHGRRPAYLTSSSSFCSSAFFCAMRSHSSSRSALTSLFRSRRRSLRDCRDNGEVGTLAVELIGGGGAGVGGGGAGVSEGATTVGHATGCDNA